MTTRHEDRQHENQRHPQQQPASAAEAQKRFIEQMAAQRHAEQERNAKAQGLAEEKRVNRDEIDTMVKGGYEHIDQPGLDPRNKPSNLTGLPEGERDPHKVTRDLEDITGNPGHRGVTPYAPATSMNPPPDPYGQVASINEPPGSEVLPPETGRIGAEHAGHAEHDATKTAEPVYDEKWEREDDDANEAGGNHRKKPKHK